MELVTVDRDAFLQETVVRIGSRLTPAEEVKRQALKAADLIESEDTGDADAIRTLSEDVQHNRTAIAEVIRKRSFHLTPDSLEQLFRDAEKLQSLYTGSLARRMGPNEQKMYGHARERLLTMMESLREDDVPKAKGIFLARGIELTLAHTRTLRIPARKIKENDIQQEEASLLDTLILNRISLNRFQAEWDTKWKKFTVH